MHSVPDAHWTLSVHDSPGSHTPGQSTPLSQPSSGFSHVADAHFGTQRQIGPQSDE
jgi:hypothetical protein